MTNKLKLAAAIKIRNKELEFEKLAAPLGLLSKINPTSFRNNILPSIGGLGIKGIGIGLSRAWDPRFGELAGSIARGDSLGSDIADIARSKLRWEGTSNALGNAFSSMSRNSMLNARDEIVLKAMKSGVISQQELADNLTRYVPLSQHKSLYDKYSKSLGSGIMNRYRGAFIL